jgi:hypothetical protein
MIVYGVDNGSLKKNLELIHTKSNHLSPRKLKEVEKGFQEAFSFFEDLHYEKELKFVSFSSFFLTNRLLIVPYRN